MRVRPRTGLLAGLAVAAALTTAFAGAASASTLSSPSASRFATSQSAATSPRTLAPDTRFYVDPASEAARQALTDLTHDDVAAAATMAKLARWPEAIWFTEGTPSEVNAGVRTLVRKAAVQRAVPVLVAYNIPLRDCSQYSSGGAQSDADYQAWISAFARGLGSNKAVLILEPDALANLPSDCSATSDPTGTITQGRLADVNYAVDALEAQPGVSVYLDAGHSQ